MSQVLINDEFMDWFRKKLDENHFWGVDRTTSFIGLDGESVPIEIRSKFMSSFSKAKMGTPNNIFMRVGNLLLIDNRIRSFLGEEELASDNIVQLWNFISFFNHHLNNLPYTALTLYILNGIDFRGKTILDLGCGEGVLSLFVLRKGAKKVYAVDADQKYEQLLKNNLKLNNLNKEFLDFIPARFDEKDKILGKIDTEEVRLSLVNVGPHFGDSDLTAFSLLPSFPNITQVLAGGYHLGADNFKPTKAILKLSEIGFNKDLTYVDFNNQHLNFLVGR